MVRGVNSWDEGRKNKFMKRHLFIMRRANGKSVWRVYRFTRFYDLELEREREGEGGEEEGGEMTAKGNWVYCIHCECECQSV